MRIPLLFQTLLESVNQSATPECSLQTEAHPENKDATDDQPQEANNLPEATTAEDVTLPEDTLPSLDDISIDRRLSSLSSNTMQTMISDLHSNDNSNSDNAQDLPEMDLRCTETMPNFDDSMSDFRNNLETYPKSDSDSDVVRLTSASFNYENNLLVESISDIFGSVCFPTSKETNTPAVERDPCLADKRESTDTSSDFHLPRTPGRKPGQDPSESSNRMSCENMNYSTSVHYANLSGFLNVSCHSKCDITLGLDGEPFEDPIASSTQTSLDSGDSSTAVSNN